MNSQQEQSQQKSPEYYDTYEEYLDSFISLKDMENLENLDVARHLVELGLNVKVQVVSRAEFTKLKKPEQSRQE